MASMIACLRFFRDTEARLREIAQRNPSGPTSDLLQLADEVADHATALKRELIAQGLIASESRRPESEN